MIITGWRRWKPRRWRLDTHNAAARWNKALLDNAARPSGALVHVGLEGTVLSRAAPSGRSAS
ncbi:MAG: hypothetical protein MZV49_19300 [Rhodopseudomonas palustris]|nr:hypothetical protein [Rhodopseudomonas palustris]